MVKFPQYDNERLFIDFARDDLSQTIIDADYFDTPLSVTGQIKVWLGSWVAKPAKVWLGSWVAKPVKHWNGTSWMETSY